MRALMDRHAEMLLAQRVQAEAELTQEIRKTIAKQLADGVPEIAFLLGFSEQSSFQRAFKRWTGLPPGQYRECGGG